MNFNRLSTRVTDVYLTDPYSTLQHYRRALRFFMHLKQANLPILQLGNKHQSEFLLKSLSDRLHRVSNAKLDRDFYASISTKYGLILCTDPVLFAADLRGSLVPVMSMVTPKEIVTNPEVVEVSDYILPVSNGRIEVAIRQLLSEKL
jgi:hypothetical protein